MASGHTGDSDRLRSPQPAESRCPLGSATLPDEGPGERSARHWLLHRGFRPDREPPQGLEDIARRSTTRWTRRISGRPAPDRPELVEKRYARLLCPDGEVRAPAALISLRGHDLVDVAPQIPAPAGPRVHVVAEGDGLVASSGPLRSPHAPVLIEGSRAVDGRGIDALGPVQVVRATITGDGADRGSSRRPPAAPAVDDVVFDERVPRPSIQGQIGVAVRAPDARVVADPSR